MKPQDSNFPEEIPPIPPPRDRRQPGAGQGAADAMANQMGDPTGDGGTADALYANSISQGRPDRPDPAPWTDSDLQDTNKRSEPLPPEPPPPARPQPTNGPPGSEITAATTTNRSPRLLAEDVWADADIPYQPKELGVVDQLLLLLADVAAVWKRCLRWVRSQLPPELQRQLSDGLLTAIALGLLFLGLVLWNPLAGGRGARVAEPAAPRPAAGEIGLVAEGALPDPTPGPTPEAAPELTPGSALTPGLAPDLTTGPEPKPTPEQRLITDIQTRVSTISRAYGLGLIQSVEVNLPGSTLGVNVAETWYGLLTAQQDEIAQDIYTQAQELRFGTLQLLDPNGVVVARNPVVGPTMVVLHRQRSPESG